MDYDQQIAAGRAHAAAGDFARAALCFEAAVARQPASVVALTGLGHCLGRTGRRRAALDCFARATPLLLKAVGKRGDPALLLAMAGELQGVRAHRESLPVIDRALKLRPAFAPAHHLRALALERLNRPEDARRAAARAAALAPRESNAVILLASLEARCGDLAAARQRLEQVAARPADPNRSRALFELGRVLDRQGQADAAFDRLAEAGRLALDAPGVAALDLDGIYRDLAEDRALCTGPWRASHGARRGAHPAPVFLIGFYRSGTTLLEQVLASHSRIRPSGEADLLPRVLGELWRRVPGPDMHWTKRLERLGPGAADDLRAFYWRAVEEELGVEAYDTLLLDKTTMNTVNIGLVLTLFPEARIVFAVRDPRDVLLSGFMQAFVPNSLTAQLLDWQRGARFYDEVMMHWRAMRAALAPDTVQVRYEDLVADLRATLVPVLTALGLDWEPGLERFHERAAAGDVATPSFADVAKPLYRDAEGRWQPYARHFASVEARLRPHIDAFGYA